MSKRKEDTSYSEFILRERDKYKDHSRTMLLTHAGGFLQQVMEQSDPPPGLLYRVEPGTATLQRVFWRNSYQIKELEKGGDFVVDLFEQAQRKATYIMRLRILTDGGFPHSLLQVVKTENWRETLPQIETPVNYKDAFKSLHSKVTSMREKGLITVTVLNAAIYTTETIRTNTEKDPFLQEFADWVVAD